ncbi:MAG: hypothetical protein ACOCZE_04355 [Planctomycetota bacterium]
MNRQTWIIALALLATATSAVAQGATLGASYTARVTGERVSVRTRPDLGASVSTRLDKGQLIEVSRNKDADWAQIKPIEGCFSLVSKQYVDLAPDGKSGTVKGRNVRVRAGGEMMTGPYNDLQDFLNTGDRVRVLGSTDDYYKIEPPAGIYWYVSRKFIQPLTPAQAAAAREALAKANRPENNQTAPPANNNSNAQPPANNETVAVATNNTTTTNTTAEQQPAQPKADPVRQAFEKAETDLKEEFKKPLDRRSFTTLLATYQSIDVDDDHYLYPWVQLRVQFLKDAIKQREELAGLSEMLQKSAAEQQRLRQERTKIEMQADGQGGPSPSSYAAQGVLEPSALYTGKAGIPRRFLLRNPQTGRVEAFVQSTGGTVDLSEYAGKHVGVYGARSFNIKLSTVLVEAQQVQVINENPDLPKAARARPIVPEAMPKAQPEPDQPAAEEPAKPAETDSAPAEPTEGSTDEPAVPNFGEQPESDETAEDDTQASSGQKSAGGLPETPAADPALNTVDEKEYK